MGAGLCLLLRLDLLRCKRKDRSACLTKVVIAEKPSVGRDIARVLGANQRRDGYLEGNGYVVTWAIGHLVHLAEPNDYGGAWDGRWSFSQLPILPQDWRLKTHKDTQSQFNTVKRLINAPQTDELICATDAGREGENIFRLIYRHAGCTKPWRRLWVSSLTDEAIEEGLRKLHPGAEFDDLAQAAWKRSQADWLMGMNLTRAYTVHHGSLYTIGRVQTPTLGMIVKRDFIISQFNKVYYYEILAHLNEGFTAKYTREKKTRIDEKPLAERLFQALKGHKTGVVVKVEKKKKIYHPPPLYDLITLQKDANKRFGLTAAEVLKLAQTLYEKYKLITYPRTESRHISEDMVPQLPKILANLNHPMARVALERLRAGHKLSKAYVDNAKLSDHHGILPTGRMPPHGFTGQLANIYGLIVKRFIAIFMPDHLVEETRVTLNIGGETFTASGSVVLDEGWKVVDPPKKDNRQFIPPLSKGQEVHINKMEMLEKETEPPKPYTDATLLTAMKNAGREVEDDALANAMKETGLGTPATRAEIIEKLVRTRLIERRKKYLHATEKGRALISVVAEPLKSPETTGAWEQQLKDIENGHFEAEKFYHSIVAFIQELLAGVRRAPRLTYREERPGRSPKKIEKRSSPAETSPSQTSERKASKRSEGLSAKNIGVCPACKRGTIIQGNRAYGCTHYNKGCRFLVNKEISGKKLTLKQVSDLISKGKTSKLTFKDQDGNPFTANLALDPQKGLSFETVAKKEKTPQEKKPLICPKCRQGHIIEGKAAHGCNRFRQGCHFVVSKEISGKKISSAQLKALVEKGKTRLIKGFMNANGEKFDAKLMLDENGRIAFET